MIKYKRNNENGYYTGAKIRKVIRLTYVWADNLRGNFRNVLCYVMKNSSITLFYRSLKEQEWLQVDYGATDLTLFCSKNNWRTGGGFDTGTWSKGVFCPEDSAICGLKTQVESYQGIGADDTALNAVEFICCIIY